MNDQPHIPNSETSKRLIANLRRSRFTIEVATLKLEEVTARLEHDTRQKRLQRLENSVRILAAESQNSGEISS